MREIDTNALTRVARVLGVGNPATAVSPVDFDDGVLQQVLEVSAMIRRARAPLGDGLFAAQIENVHAGAGAETTQRDPYDLAVATGAGWPDPVPADFDVWVLGAIASAATGVQSGSNASRFSITYPGTQVAFGSTSTIDQLIKAWLSEVPIGAGAVSFLGGAGDGNPAYEGPAWRVPRGALLTFQSSAGGAGSIFLQMVLGLFPSNLGYDGRGA